MCQLTARTHLLLQTESVPSTTPLIMRDAKGVLNDSYDTGKAPVAGLTLSLASVPAGSTPFVLDNAATNLAAGQALLVQTSSRASGNANHKYKVLEVGDSTCTAEAVCQAHGVPFRKGECLLPPATVVATL